MSLKRGWLLRTQWLCTVRMLRHCSAPPSVVATKTYSIFLSQKKAEYWRKMGNEQAGDAQGGDDERENCDGEAPAAQEDEESQEIRDEEEWGDEDELGGAG